MTSRNGRSATEPDAMPQFGFALDYLDSRTRSQQLKEHRSRSEYWLKGSPKWKP